ncbi:MAG: histidine phosphatase family protein [Leucobacter sp.]
MGVTPDTSTLELVLVRHAKSDWGDPSLADHDRPLNARGRRNAPEMAQRFAASRARVDRILSSTALRARTTAQAFGDVLGLPVELRPEMYASSPSTLASMAADSGVRRVMLVAHDPGITELAERASAGEITHLPTGAVARFAWTVPGSSGQADHGWNTIDWDRAEMWSLDTPRGGATG